MTRLPALSKFLLLGVLTIVFLAQSPPPGYTKVVTTRSDQTLIPELELIKEEETVSIASRHEQPISQAPSNVYVITDEDIRHSGATDIPTILRRIPGIEVMQMRWGRFQRKCPRKQPAICQQDAGLGRRTLNLCRCTGYRVLEGHPRDIARNQTH